MRKQSVLNLWQNVFNDPPAFVRLFFDRVYREENCLTIEKGGEVVSALQMLPYQMTFCGEEIPVSYIYGACTLEAERSRGYMAELLRESFEIMRSRGIALTVLIPAEPWLFDYYQRFDYATCFDYSLETIEKTTLPADPSLQIRKAGGKLPATVYSYFDRMQKKRPCHLLHSQADFEVNITDVEDSGGALYYACIGEQICALAFAVPTESGDLYIKEGFYDSGGTKSSLIQYLLQYYKASKAICQSLPVPGNSVPFGMARAIDRERLTELWLQTYPEDSREALNRLPHSAFIQTVLQYPRRAAYMNLILD